MSIFVTSPPTALAPLALALKLPHCRHHLPLSGDPQAKPADSDGCHRRLAAPDPRPRERTGPLGRGLCTPSRRTRSGELRADLTTIMRHYVGTNEERMRAAVVRAFSSSGCASESREPWP